MSKIEMVVGRLVGTCEVLINLNLSIPISVFTYIWIHVVRENILKP